MVDLRRLAAGRYRLAWDESAETPGQTEAERAWLRQVPCLRGHIFIQAKGRLGVWCDKGPTIAKLAALPGVVRLCRGDRESSFSFPPELFAQVAEFMGARKRRQVHLTPEQLATRRAHMRSINAARATTTPDHETGQSCDSQTPDG